ncbi:MAG TPA: hypothetical protein VJ464_11320 [Blastocatellia bacterium]|nr:hypothetical protein [Blastocatellia bacterium]
MKSRINWLPLVLTMVAVLFGGCSLNAGASRTDSAVPAPEVAKDPEQLIKQGEYDISLSPARELAVIRRVQLRTGGESSVKSPISVASAGEKGLLICDNNGHAVQMVPSDSDQVVPLIPRENEKPLVWPFSMRVWKKSIYVSDNEGIKVYDQEGLFQRLLRAYYQINDFEIGADGTIYIAPVFRVFKPSNPLLVRLDQEGKRVDQFGVRLNRAEHRGLDDNAYIAAGDNLIVTAFHYRPLVQFYGAGGKLMRQIIIDHPIFSRLRPLEQDSAFTHPAESKYRLPAYIAGLKLLNDRVLILLDLPKPEVVELNLRGEEVARYRGEAMPGITDYRGFEAEAVGDQYRISTIVTDNLTFMTLVQFAASRAK